MISPSGKRLGSLALSVFGIALLSSHAQTVAKPPVKTPATGGNSFPGPNAIRYEDGTDREDTLIDKFMGDWHDSMPRHEHGSLVLRDILTHGNNLTPPQPGAVLQATNFVSYGRLQPRDVTTSEKLEGQQEVYYVESGEGDITAGGKTSALHKDIAVLMPEGLEFTIRNSGSENLTLYVINEPTPKGLLPAQTCSSKTRPRFPLEFPWKPRHIRSPELLDTGPMSSAIFSHADGLAALGDLITVDINPMQMGEPHPHNIGQEEVWCAIEGTSLAFLGTQLRVQSPGMAYMIRPDQTMTHSNINVGDTPVKFLWY